MNMPQQLSVVSASIVNYFTVDVEDYFQVAAFDKIVPVSSWGEYESRVENNTLRLLDVLSRYNVRATFFVVGWIAERYPSLIKRIHSRGHEIACHSYLHQKIYTLSPQSFREDTQKAKDILEQIVGNKILGYRAPTYTITKKTLWALDILEELGFSYDSSIFPITHDNYGIPDAPRFQYKHENHDLIEYPLSTTLILGRKVPAAGGGYFRLFPLWFSVMALRRINEQEKKPFVFYVHPWEIDADQPRMVTASFFSRFRHYNNLEKTMDRLHVLLKNFAFRPFRESMIE